MSSDQLRIVLTVAVVIFTVMATYSVVGLVAAWGALGRGHWFSKTAAALAFPSLWLFTCDPRLCLVFLSQTAVVLLRLWWLRSRSDRAESATCAPTTSRTDTLPGQHYSLTDLLSVFVLLSGILAMLVRLPREVRWDWYWDVLPGAMMGGFTLVALWAVESKQSRWLRAATVVVAFPAIVMASWLLLAASARGPFGRATAALLLMAVLPARVYYVAYKARTLAYPPPLANNGYVDLLRAARAIDNPWANVDTLSPAELRTYLREQETALALVKKGLSSPCQAMLYDGMNDSALSSEGQRFQKLSEIVAAQGRQELDDGRLEAAVDSYIADIELGAAMVNGGVMMHDGFGFICERLGVEGLQKIVSQLDDEGCRKLAERLAEIDARREPPEASEARERLYFSRSYPWKHRENMLSLALYFLLPEKRLTVDVLFWAAGREKRARVRLLICHLALRRFWLSERDYPETLEQLVPRYLVTVPLDPFADGTLIYKKLPAAYLLYSIGDDRIDDSGAPSAPFALPVPKGDIVVAVDLQPTDGKAPSEIEIGK